MGSVGTLLPNQTLKYMSPSGQDLVPGTPGELWIKGPNVFLGYLNQPEATANALHAEGYFKTGDIGYQDEHGNLYITDRIKELIKYKEFQVAPAELEALLLTHPKTSDVAVIGIYNKEQVTEVPRAYVMLNTGITANKQTSDELVMNW